MENEDQVAKTLVTIRDYIRYAISRFTKAGIYYGHGTDNPNDEAIDLIFYLLDLPFRGDVSEEPYLAELLDARLTMNERKLIVRMIETRCIDRVPVPYITGKSRFAGLQFRVDERVLIPRSPIAELIEREFSPWLSDSPASVLDLCCGSGCIGIACALYLNSDVVLSDLSSEALEVARQNIQLHQVEDKVSLVQSDLLDEVAGTFDLIVSNPPYVDSEDIASMPAEYQHEPRSALEAGEDGLLLARKILSSAADKLNGGGHLIMELGNSFVHLEKEFNQVPWTWIDFERGGHGVLVIGKEELEQYF